LDLAARIQAEGVIFHVGSLKDEPDETCGLKRAARSIDTILSRTTGNTPLLLEVSAGSGKIIGSRFTQLTRIFDWVSPQNQKRVLFALDSQHLWASGYDIASDLQTLLEEIKNTVGIERVAAIHLNDSKSELASCHDRHADLGTGTIGWDALSAFINHPLLQNIPTILETPSLRTEEGAKNEIAALRRMANEGPASS
jgi:deoxyribonuclease-4